jgi:hypothetical protein
MRFKARARGYKVGATLGELMRGSVWPRRARVGHGSRMVKSQNPVESVSKAAEDCRTPRAGAGSQRPPEIQEALNISLWPVRQAGILPAFSAHSQRLKIRESVLGCAGL